MGTLITGKESESNYLRGKSAMYIAGWVAHRSNENPQKKPEDYDTNPKMKEWYDDYLLGYGDNLANAECISAVREHPLVQAMQGFG